MLMAMVGTSGDQQGRRSGNRRKSEEKVVRALGVNPVLPESVKRDRDPMNAESHRQEGRRHRKLLVWDQDGYCHEGTTGCIGRAMIFIESTWMAPVGSEVTISLVPEEEDAVGHELTRGMVVWHCPLADEFRNQAGFGVLFQRQCPQLPSPEPPTGSKESV